MKIEEFDKKNTLQKKLILGHAEAHGERLKEERAVFESFNRGGRGKRLVSMSDDIAILEDVTNPVFEDYPFTFSLKSGDVWDSSNTYYKTADRALLGALGVKHIGPNSDFCVLAARMLEI